MGCRVFNLILCAQCLFGGGFGFGRLLLGGFLLWFFFFHLFILFSFLADYFSVSLPSIFFLPVEL